jgi:HEAT repeat protein
LRGSPGKEIPSNQEWDAEVLSGDNYPELRLRSEWTAAVQVVESKETASPETQFENLIKEGQLRNLDGARLAQIYKELLSNGFQALFILVVDQVRIALDSSAPDDRRWALESVGALTSLEDLNLIPYGTLPLLLDCVGRLLVKEERVELRDSALEITALLLGIEAAQGELESAQAHLAWLQRATRTRGAEYTGRILASRKLVQPILQLFFREGRAVLESRVMPFLTFNGEIGARTLVQLLDEENDRQHRNRILELLKRLGPLSIHALQEGLVAGSWHLVRNALNVVGDLEEPLAFEYVVPCLEHSDDRVVHAAIRALWKTGGAQAERYLLERLPHVAGETRTLVLDGLGRIGTAASLPVLATLAASGEDGPRVAACHTLGLLKQADALPTLIALLKRRGRIFKTAEPMAVRLAAAQALASIGSLEARRLLDEAISEEPKGRDREALQKIAMAANNPG